MGKLPGGDWDRIFILMRRMEYHGVFWIGRGRLRAEPVRRMSEAYFSLGFGLRCGSVTPRFLLVAGLMDLSGRGKKHWDDGAAISTALMACWGVAGVVGGVCGC
jgi:hypothetical protein